MDYIGSRYIPKFMGDYDNTQMYEALCVVDNGSGTSYISQKIVPPGTPLTDTDYWAVYGASSGAIINLQNQIDAIHDSFVTPELFNAAGDGITDDTAALRSALTSGKNVFLGKNKTYLISDKIDISHNCIIIGDNSKIKANIETDLIRVTSDVKNILIFGVSFEAPIASTIDTALLGFIENTNDLGINEGCCNITVDSCRFKGGCIELELNSTTNAIVRNCIFGNCAIRSGAPAGGYCILIQSSYNTLIENCLFVDQKNVRHKIYVSNNSNHVNNISNYGVVVNNSFFDDTEQLYVATNTSALNIRSTYDMEVSNCYFKHCVGFTLTAENGDITAFIKNNTFDDTVYRSSGDAPNECRSCINMTNAGTTNMITFEILNNNEINTSTSNVYWINVAEYSKGKIENNFTSANKWIQLNGHADVNNNGGEACDYVYRVFVATYTGHVGKDFLAKTGRRYILDISSAGDNSMKLSQIPSEWLTFKINFNTSVVYGDIEPPFTCTKNDDNDYTLKFPWCSDSDCFVFGGNDGSNCFVVKVSASNNTGLEVRIKLKDFSGNNFTGSNSMPFMIKSSRF